jgi:ornithine decarboxylase
MAYYPSLKEDDFFKRAQQIISQGEKEAFYIVRPESVLERLKIFNEYLPMVKVFYAVKSNPNERIIKCLMDAGCNFDCASKAEIDELVTLGCSPDRIIFAHPTKDPE